jgi:prepilin-type N-terminal cleavage/methylation domain-containing protein
VLPLKADRGSTLAELLVVLAVMGLTLGVAAMNVRPMETPLQTGTALLEAVFHQARLQAIATTSAFRIIPAGSTQLRTEHAESCMDTTWTADPSLRVELPAGVTQSPTTWSVCFSSRGISTNNVVVTLSHAQYGEQKIEVLLGGTTRVLE